MSNDPVDMISAAVADAAYAHTGRSIDRPTLRAGIAIAYGQDCELLTQGAVDQLDAERVADAAYARTGRHLDLKTLRAGIAAALASPATGERP